jgi:ArsR family transcriptional regulator
MKKDQLEYSCDCTVVHDASIQKVKAFLPAEDQLITLANFYKVFADPTRTKILSALALQEMCVCDIAALLTMTKSAISHQLRTLRDASLVRSRRQGKEIFYSLDDDHVVQVLTQGLSHIQEKLVQNSNKGDTEQQSVGKQKTL